MVHVPERHGQPGEQQGQINGQVASPASCDINKAKINNKAKLINNKAKLINNKAKLMARSPRPPPAISCMYVKCMCVRVCVCVRVCARVCVRVCIRGLLSSPTDMMYVCRVCACE